MLEALKLTRSDLIRALKTEQILRQNEDLIKQQECFGDNLAALTALQVSERASEQRRILDAALQIAVQVRSQIRQLQQQKAQTQDDNHHEDAKTQRHKDTKLRAGPHPQIFSQNGQV